MSRPKRKASPRRVVPKRRATQKNNPWQLDLGQPVERLSTMFKLSKFTDLTISFPRQRQTLKVHRLILAMSSPVFEAMIYGPMAEKGTIELPEDPPKAFSWLLDYMYQGTTSLPDVDMATKVYHLANKYQINKLRGECSTYLQSHVKQTNLAHIYGIAMLFEDSDLQEKCRNVVHHYSEEVLSSARISQLDAASMEDILKQDFLCVESEVCVFNGLLKWGTSHLANSSSQSEECASLRTTVAPLLPHIRFLTMSTDQFVQHVMPSAVLTLEECNSILMNIRLVEGFELPSICSTNRRIRMFYSENQLHKISLQSEHYVYEEPDKVSRVEDDDYEGEDEGNEQNRNEDNRSNRSDENESNQSDDEPNDEEGSEGDGSYASYDNASYNNDYDRNQDDDYNNPPREYRHGSRGSASSYEEYDSDDIYIKSTRKKLTEIISGFVVNKELHVSCIEVAVPDDYRKGKFDEEVDLVLVNANTGVHVHLKASVTVDGDYNIYTVNLTNPLVILPYCVSAIALRGSFKRRKKRKLSITYGSMTASAFAVGDSSVDLYFYSRGKIF